MSLHAVRIEERRKYLSAEFHNCKVLEKYIEEWCKLALLYYFSGEFKNLPDTPPIGKCTILPGTQDAMNLKIFVHKLQGEYTISIKIPWALNQEQGIRNSRNVETIYLIHGILLGMFSQEMSKLLDVCIEKSSKEKKDFYRIQKFKISLCNVTGYIEASNIAKRMGMASIWQESGSGCSLEIIVHDLNDATKISLLCQCGKYIPLA